MNESQLKAMLGPYIKGLVRDVMSDLQGDLRVAGNGQVTGRLNAKDYSWDDRELELGWIKDNVIWIYGSATTFLIYGDDASERFPAGTKVRWKQGGSYLYATVVSAAYSTGTTTVTVSGDSLTATDLTDNYFSYAFAAPGWTPDEGPLQFYPLTTPLTSTSWDGDPYSTTSKTKIDLSAVFGVPADVKAVLVKVQARDSGSASSNAYFALSPNDIVDSVSYQLWIEGVPNDERRAETAPVPCDENGDIYYQNAATGTGTMDVWITIWGYWI